MWYSSGELVNIPPGPDLVEYSSGELVNIPPGPDLVEHNVLHVAEHHRTEKGPHDIMTNINIVFHSFVT